MKHPEYRPDIDGLRAVAVLSVVGFHAFPTAFPGGFVGVDIFFVISGFLISNIVFGSLDTGQFSFQQFYARRIKRIFPALMLVLFFCLAVGRLKLLADEYKELGKHISAGTGFVSNIVLWKESGYFDSAAELKPLLHLWSLGIEEQFYLLWPPLLFLAWKRGWVGGLLITLCTASFAINIGQIKYDPVAAFYLPFSRMWELLIGCCLSYSFQVKKETAVVSVIARKLRGNASSVTGLVLVLCALFVLDRKTPFPGWAALLPTIGALLLISAGSEAWVNRHILSNRAFVFIGLISYPLYLWHWPLLSFAHITLSKQPPNGTVTVIVFVSVVLAWLTYRFVERPIRRAQTFRLPLGLVGVAAAAGCIGLYVYQTNGMAGRYQTLSPVAVDQVRTPSASASPSDNHAALDNTKLTALEGGVPKGAEKPNVPAVPSSAEAGKVEETPSTVVPKPDVLQPPQETPEQIYAHQQSQFLWVENGDNTSPECLAKFSIEPYHDNKCEVADSHRDPTVALLGDSHANAMFLGLAKYYSSHGENLVNLGRGGCLPFWGVNTDYVDRAAGCAEFMDRLLDYAKTSASIHTVLLAATGNLYMDGGIRPVVSTSDPGNKAASQVYMRELKNTITKFTAAKKKVILVIDYPEMSVDPHSCIRRPDAEAPLVTKCATPQSWVDMKAEAYRRIMFSVLAAFPNVGYIDIAPAFCDGVDCWAMKGNVLLYRDGDHLSHDGSLYFSSFVKVLHFRNPPSQ